MNGMVLWATNFLKIVDIFGNFWILSSRNARETAGQIHPKCSARLPYIHHDTSRFTNRGGLFVIGGGGDENDQLA